MRWEAVVSWGWVVVEEVVRLLLVDTVGLEAEKEEESGREEGWV
jgi:hypothetical protein